MNGWLFAAGGGICFAALDAIRKRLVQRVDMLALLTAISAGNAVLYAAWVYFSPGTIAWTSYVQVGIPALVLQLTANLTLLRALQVSDLSRTIPFLGLTPVLSGLAGQYALAQWPRPGQWAGIAAVSLGAGLLAFVRSHPHRAGLDRGSLLAMITAGLWSITAALDKLAIDASSPAIHALLQAGGIAALLVAILVVRGRLSQLADLRRVARGCGWAILFGTLALAFQFLAIELIWVSLMETIKRATGAVSSLVVGRVWFGEPIDAAKVAAVLLLVLGTGLSLML